MDFRDIEHVIIRFWPSAQDIQESALTDAYMGALEEFYDSLDELVNSLRNEFYKAESQQVRKRIPLLEPYTGPFIDQGEEISRDSPPAVAKFIMYLSTTGITVAAYKLLRLWVESKIGRKIRVKIREFELEASQLSVEQYQKLFEILYEHHKVDKLLEKREELRAKYRSEGFILIDGKQSMLEESGIKRMWVDKSRR